MAGEDIHAGLPAVGLIFGLRICWASQTLSVFSAAACGWPAWESLVTAAMQEVASESAAAAGAATAVGDCQQNWVRREELPSCSRSSPGL